MWIISGFILAFSKKNLLYTLKNEKARKGNNNCRKNSKFFLLLIKIFRLKLKKISTFAIKSKKVTFKKITNSIKKIPNFFLLSLSAIKANCINSIFNPVLI